MILHVTDLCCRKGRAMTGDVFHTGRGEGGQPYGWADE